MSAIGAISLQTRRLIVNGNDDSGLAATTPASQVDWLGYSGAQQAERNNSAEGIPFARATHPSYGISSDELAEAQRKFTTYARLRLQGVGHVQYDRGDKQAFEDMDLHRLINEMRDEIADSVNYLAFMDIQLSRWKNRLESKA
jgi:hypothetical protein